MDVTERHIRLDCHRFSDSYATDLDIAKRALILKNFDYPAGWRPTPAPLLIHYPKNYPQLQPRVYLPRFLSFTKASETHRYGDKTQSLAGIDWILWCTHRVDWHRDIEEFFRNYIRPSLKHPDRNNPAHRE